MRLGSLSRAPLYLLRLQVTGNAAECDWIAREPDPWDIDLARDIAQRHATLQALKDAIDIRSLLLDALPDVRTARIRVFRRTSTHSRDLIILGNIRRQDSAFQSVHSLAMRAKLIGFYFRLENNLLCRLTREEQFGFSD